MRQAYFGRQEMHSLATCSLAKRQALHNAVSMPPGGITGR